jgi:hypothetical protein
LNQENILRPRVRDSWCVEGCRRGEGFAEEVRGDETASSVAAEGEFPDLLTDLFWELLEELEVDEGCRSRNIG